ncbi:HDOD domain-containing protein [Roseateles sp. BYS180W]|uniref:HDOD domain-containing protein n=1 Tax=Roseateles rivi TaxID=3299028 RepID=A0ABW7FYG9_9BURK
MSAKSLTSITSELDFARRDGALRQVQIPPCPQLLLQLREAMEASPQDLAAVASIAQSDVAMSATLLRLANSPLHRVDGPPCTSVGQALNRLGLDEAARVMAAFLVRHALPVHSPHLARFWERSAKRALAMRHIASHLPGMCMDLAHNHGLFLHVGMPVLLQSFRSYGSTLVEAAARIDRPFIATENANHHTDHAVVGALVARAWHLRGELMQSIRLHHDMEALGDTTVDSEVRTLIAAGLVAEHLMRLHEAMPEDADWQAHKDLALNWLHIDADELLHWRDTYTELMDAHGT